MAGLALKFDKLRGAKWTSYEKGKCRIGGGRSMTNAMQSFSVTAEVNGEERVVDFDLWHKGSSRDVFKADLDERTSICLKVVANRADYEYTVIVEDACSKNASWDHWSLKSSGMVT
jgi:hypothetical protein